MLFLPTFRRALSALPGLALALAAHVAAAASGDPTGTWLTQDGRARVRVEKCPAAKNQVCGYAVWVKPGGKAGPTDKRNPDATKTGRAILGHQMLMGLKPNSDGEYEGQVYNAEDGKSYDVTVWPEGGNLMVKGCLVAFLCSTQTWTKATDVAPGQLMAATGMPGGPQPDPEYADKSGTGTASTPSRRDPKPRS